jgi:hypothetical protein
MARLSAIFNKWLHALILYLMVASVLSGCAPNDEVQSPWAYFVKLPLLGLDGRYWSHHHEAAPFHPEDISCTDKTTPEQKAKWESFRNSPDGDLFLMAHLDELLSIARDMANQGDPVAMEAFGGLKQEFLAADYSSIVSRTEFKTIPEHERRDIVIALTYVYIADIIEGIDKRKKYGMLTRLEAGGYKEIPPAWIAEAKENAARWRDYCAKK